MTEARAIPVQFKRYNEGQQLSAWMYVTIPAGQSEGFIAWSETQEQFTQCVTVTPSPFTHRITFTAVAEHNELEAAIQATLTSLEALLDSPLDVDDQGFASPVSHDPRFTAWIEVAFLDGPEQVGYRSRSS